MGKKCCQTALINFILGSAIVGIAGAMLVTQDGLFTPGSYQPMRYTFFDLGYGHCWWKWK